MKVLSDITKDNYNFKVIKFLDFNKDEVFALFISKGADVLIEQYAVSLNHLREDFINYQEVFFGRAIQESLISGITNLNKDWYKNKIKKSRLGQVLVDNGFITQGKLDQALRVQQKSGQPIGVIMINLGYITKEDMIIALHYQKCRRKK